MPPSATTRAAAIDIGSNTVHLLVGSWRDGGLEPVDDASELVGLSQDVYAGGAISPARLAEAVDAVGRLVRRARDDGADPIMLVATAAVRDTANVADLIAAVRERSGLDLQVISGECEAALTYRGAAAGDDSRRLQVCDVGGGSTEVIRAADGHVTLQTSLPLGSGRLTRLYASDPPTAEELARSDDEVARTLSALPPWQPARLVVTGGTATALAQMAGGTARSYTLSTAGLADLRATLARRRSGEVAATYAIKPERARLLPAGTAIITALVAATGVASLVLTAAGLRDGLLIDHFTGKGS